MTTLAKITKCWRAMLRDVTAGVTTLGVLALPAIIGATGLTVDVSRGYQQKVANQRAADMAALAAATAYNANASTSVLQPTAADLVLVNGINDATTTANLVSNYPASGQTSVKVTVTRPVPFYLASVLGLTGSFNVNAASYAQLGSSSTVSAPCYLALSNSATAINMSGGATISAPACAIAAVGGINQGATSMSAKDIVSGGSNVVLDYGSLSVTDNLYYSGTFTFPGWNTAVPATSKRKRQATTLGDPWASNSERTSAVSLIGTYTSVPALTNPTTSGSGGAWSVTSSTISTPGATTTYNASTKTYTVSSAGTFNITTLTMSGDRKLVFANGSNILIHNGVSLSGSTTVNFGNSNVYINGNFTGNSAGVTFGDGVLWMGSGTVTLAGTNTKGAGDVTINSTVTLSGGSTLAMGAGTHNFGRIRIEGGSKMKLGAGNFQASNGISIDGDSELSLGAGNVLLGKHTDGYSVYMTGGSARFFMGDGTFSASGNIDTTGGSRIVFGAATNHYINGNLNIRGAVLFGAGRYTINGNFINGTGGATWPTGGYTAWNGTVYGASAAGYDQWGTGVTFVMSGTLNLAGGAKTYLVAPDTTTTGGGIAELLLTSATTSATTWNAGATNAFGGAIHVPNSAVTMSGGNTTVATGKCFSLIASTITISGGGQTGTSCSAMSGAYTGGGSGTVRLVN